jgi:hypothetical protein
MKAKFTTIAGALAILGCAAAVVVGACISEHHVLDAQPLASSSPMTTAPA